MFYRLTILYSRPAENFWEVMPQTPFKFLGQNLFGDHFWGQSGRESVAPGYFRSRGYVADRGVALGPKIAWGYTFAASDQPQKWSPNRFWPKNLSEV